MTKFGTRDDDALSEYVKFRKIVKWCYKRAATSVATERVDLVVPRVDDVRRDLRTKVDGQEKMVMLKPGEAIWYAAERDVWNETIRVLKEDASAREGTIHLCTMIDLKKIPLLVLIKIIEPMDIFRPKDISAAIRAHALDTHSRLQETLEYQDMEEYKGPLLKQRTKNSNLPCLRSTVHKHNRQKLENDSCSSDAEMDDYELVTNKISQGFSPSDGGDGEVNNDAFTRRCFPKCTSSEEDENDDAFLRKHLPNCTNPSEDEASHATRKPSSAIGQINTGQESPNDEENDGTERSTFPANDVVDSLRFDLDEPNSHPGVPCCHCFYT